MKKVLPADFCHLLEQRFRREVLVLFLLLFLSINGCMLVADVKTNNRNLLQSTDIHTKSGLAQKDGLSDGKQTVILKAGSSNATATALPVSLPIHAVARMDANCRWGPGEDYAVVSGLYSEQAARLLGSNDDRSWWLVEMPDGTMNCWIAAFTVRLNRDLDELPVMTPPSSVSPPTATSIPPTPQPLVIYHEYEKEILEFINSRRRDAGVAELSMQPQLTMAARLHSRDMAQQGYFSHTGLDGSSPFDRIHAEGYSFSYAAENIAAGHGKPQEAVEAWMNSEGHRRNLLDAVYTQVGIAYVYDADSEYITYWTTVFGTP